MIKKLIALILVIALAYVFVFQGKGVSWLGGSGLSELDRKYMSESAAWPDADQLQAYARALETFKEQNKGNGTLLALTDIRWKAVKLAIHQERISEKTQLIDFRQVDCSNGSAIQEAIKLLEENKTSARTVLTQIKSAKKETGTDARLENIERTVQALVAQWGVQQLQLQDNC